MNSIYAIRKKKKEKKIIKIPLFLNEELLVKFRERYRRAKSEACISVNTISQEINCIVVERHRFRFSGPI